MTSRVHVSLVLLVSLLGGSISQVAGQVAAIDSAASQPAVGNPLAAKIASLRIGQATPQQVITQFGQPQGYVWNRQKLDPAALPDTYIMEYPGNLQMVISRGRVTEVRFEGPGDYVFRNAIRVGSSLEEVLKVLPPPRTLQGQKNEFKDGFLYKDIQGRKGSHYYARADQGIRLFFWNDNVSALYLTAAQSQRAAPAEPAAVAAHQHVAQHEPRADQDMVALARKAEAMVQAIAAGRFEEARATFSPMMKQAVSADQLAATWRQLQEAGGAFQGIDKGSVGQRNQAIIVSIPARWTRNQIMFQVIYDSRGQVTGLWTAPPAAAQPQPMADLPRKSSGSPRIGSWSPQTDRGTQVDHAWQIVQFLREGQAGLAPQYFGEQLLQDQGQVVRQLRDTWAEMERVGGELLEAGEPRTQSDGQNTVVYIPLYWKRNSAEMKFVFNPAKRVIALTALPLISPPAVASSPAATQPILLTDRARMLVQNWADGQYEKVRGEFDIGMKPSAPVTELRRTWEQLSQAGGQLESIGTPRAEQVEQVTLVYVPVRWQRNAVDVKIVYDNTSHVTGLVIVPSQADETAASQPAARKPAIGMAQPGAASQLGFDPDFGRQMRLMDAVVEATEAWLQSGRSEDAAKCDAALEQLLNDRRVGREPSSRFAAAKIFWLRNKPEKAMEILRQLAKDARPGDTAPGMRVPAKVAALLWLGTIQRHSGRTAEARGTYESLLSQEASPSDQMMVMARCICHLYLAELDKAGHRNDQAIAHLDAVVATKAAASSRPKGTAGCAEQMAPWQHWAEHQKILLTRGPAAADAAIRLDPRVDGLSPLVIVAHLSLIGVAAIDWSGDTQVFSDTVLRRTMDACPHGSLDHDLAVYTIGFFLWYDAKRMHADVPKDAQAWFRRGYESESYFALPAGLMLARCQVQAGQTSQAQATIAEMKKRYPAAKVSIEDLKGTGAGM